MIRQYLRCTLICTLLTALAHADPVVFTAPALLRTSATGIERADIVGTALPDGTSLFAWTRPVGTVHQLEFLMVGPDGVAISSPRTVALIERPARQAVALATADGTVAMVWEDRRGATIDLAMVVIDSSGRILSSGFVTGDPTSLVDDDVSPGLAGSLDGIYTLVWTRRSPQGGATPEILVRDFDQTLTTLNASLRVDLLVNAYGFADHPTVARWPGGRMWIAWQDGQVGGSISGPDGDEAGIGGVLLSSTRSLISSGRLNANTPGSQFAPELRTGGGEAALLAYRDRSPGMPERVMGLRLGRIGGLIDPAGFQLAPISGSGGAFLHDVEMTESEEWVVLSSPVSGTGQVGSALRYTRWTSLGTPLEEATLPINSRRASGGLAIDAWGNFRTAMVVRNGATTELIHVTAQRQMVRVLTPPLRGSELRLLLDSPSDPGAVYQFALSLNEGPTRFGRHLLGLEVDPLFVWSLAPTAGLTSGFQGQLDTGGRTQVGITLPPDPAIAGLQLFCAFVTLDVPFQSAVQTVSATTSITIR